MSQVWRHKQKWGLDTVESGSTGGKSQSLQCISDSVVLAVV